MREEDIRKYKTQVKANITVTKKTKVEKVPQ